ncbi:retrovirus-related pol polyprotein from transposon TNT 1-94 [Tanacetum coccineum]
MDNWPPGPFNPSPPPRVSRPPPGFPNPPPEFNPLPSTQPFFVNINNNTPLLHNNAPPLENIHHPPLNLGNQDFLDPLNILDFVYPNDMPHIYNMFCQCCSTTRHEIQKLRNRVNYIGFARFNTIITSLKALDEGFSSKNYVRRFLRALHPKWRAKFTAIEQLKDLSSLALGELIGSIKVHEVVMEKDFKIYRGQKERVKSITLKTKKESSDDETSTSESDDEEYAMAVRNFKRFFRRKGKFVRQPREEKKLFRQRDEKKGKSDHKCFRCGDLNHLIGDCPKPSRNKDQKVFIGGSWSDSENDDKTNDETCLMAQSSNEVCLRTCLEPDKWIKDSGCSKHMTGNKSLFSTYKAYDRGNVVFGSNLKGKIIGKGIISNDSLTISNVEHVDNLAFNLLSVGQICDNKCQVLFTEEGSEIIKDGKTIGNEIRKNGLYVMKLGNKSQEKSCLATVVDNSNLWHRRPGHANMRLIQSFSSKELVRNLPKLKYDKFFCDACKIGKQAHASHKAKNMVSTKNV